MDPTSDPPVPLADAEEARIRGAYARRRPSERYSWFTDAQVLLIQERERAVLRLLRQAGITRLGDRDILEVGCGSGFWLREFIKWGADPARLVGVDLLEDRIADARRLTAPGVRFRAGTALGTGLAAHGFDLVLQATVFTSILDPAVRRALATEMLRLLRPGGHVLWYDFRVNNPRNPDVRGVGAAEIRRLFPGCALRLRRVTLAPPLARAVAPRSRALATVLTALPWLRTHYLALITPASAGEADRGAGY